MKEEVSVFSISIGPAEPGLSTAEIARRRKDAYRTVRAVMPSSAYLLDSVLEDRVVSDGRSLYLSFSLIETEQLQLFDARDRRRKHALSTKLHSLYGELERMKSEAARGPVRVADLTAFAAGIGSMPSVEIEEELASLSEADALLFDLMIKRRGRPIAFHFSDSSIVELELPVLFDYCIDETPIEVTFKVKATGSRKARVDGLRARGEGSAHKFRAPLPEKTALFRPACLNEDETKTWFLLYVAAFRGLNVEAKVRRAVRLRDGAVHHIELVSIDNRDSLFGELQQLSR